MLNSSSSKDFSAVDVFVGIPVFVAFLWFADILRGATIVATVVWGLFLLLETALDLSWTRGASAGLLLVASADAIFFGHTDHTLGPAPIVCLLVSSLIVGLELFGRNGWRAIHRFLNYGYEEGNNSGNIGCELGKVAIACVACSILTGEPRLAIGAVFPLAIRIRAYGVASRSGRGSLLEGKFETELLGYWHRLLDGPPLDGSGLEPGQVRIATHQVIDDPRGLLPGLGVCGILLFLTLALGSCPTPVLELPAAPDVPENYASISFASPDHPDSSVSFVVSSTLLTVHVVKTLPPDAVLVRKGSWREFATGNRPLAFDGDVDIDVGQLVGSDYMRTLVGVQAPRVKDVEILYRGAFTRGPPAGKPIDMYVVGTVQRYQGPSQVDASGHRAIVLDLSLSEKDRNAYEGALAVWHDKLAQKTGLPSSEFERVTEESAARGIVEQVRSPTGGTRPGEFRPSERPAECFRPIH